QRFRYTEAERNRLLRQAIPKKIPGIEGGGKMKAGKIFSRILTAVCLCVYLFPLTVFAETGGNEKSYTYTVTLYAGNQGSFADADGVSVSGSGQVSYADGNQIQITG